jgi:hypothetical protein
MNGVFSAEGTELVQFQTVGRVFLVLVSIVIALLTLSASEGNFNSCAGFCHFSAPPYTMFGPVVKKSAETRCLILSTGDPESSVL